MLFKQDLILQVFQLKQWWNSSEPLWIFLQDEKNPSAVEIRRYLDGLSAPAPQLPLDEEGLIMLPYSVRVQSLHCHGEQRVLRKSYYLRVNCNPYNIILEILTSLRIWSGFFLRFPTRPPTPTPPPPSSLSRYSFLPIYFKILFYSF